MAAASVLRVRLEDPRLVGQHDRLDAVAEVELLEDVRDVCLDGGRLRANGSRQGETA